MNYSISDWKKLFAQTQSATGYTPADIRRQSGQSQTPKSEESEAFKLKAKELIAIQQLNQKGLEVIDINPGAIERMENFCCYDANVIHEVLGTENIANVVAFPTTLYYDQADGVVANPQLVVSPYWRSIFIPLVGNFVKIEYLNARVAVDNSNLSFTVQGIVDRSEPEGTSELSYFTAPPTYFAANKLASDKIILVDFNAPTSKPIVAKHGDSFENYFSGVWVTFKQDSPRIRITVGYNSKVHSQENRPETLHLWEGHGLRNNSSINPVPFCLSDKDITIAGTGWAVAAAVEEFCLVANPAAVQNWEVNGLGILFLNSLNFGILKDNVKFYLLDFELIIKTLGTAGSIYLTGSQVIKRVCGAASAKDANNHYGQNSVQFAEPIRVSLRKNTGLFIRVTRVFTDDADPVKVKFTASGYSMGPLFYGRLSSNVPVAPFTPRYKFTENPYPIDLDDFGMPQS